MRLLPHLSKISFRLALLGAMAVGIVLALEFGTTTSQRASANPTYGTVTPNPASTFIIQGYKFSLPVQMTTGTIGPYPASCPSGPYTADNFCRLGAYGIVLNYDGSKVTLDTSTGTSTGSNTTTTLKDTTKTWKINEWANSRVFITGGAGATQDRLVVSNTANTLTVTPAWDAFPAVPPDNTSVYTVGGMTNGGFLGSTGRPVICPVGGQTAVGWAELHCITTGDYTIRGANGTGILTNLTLATNAACNNPSCRQLVNFTYTFPPANPNTIALTVDGYNINPDFVTGARRIVVCPDSSPVSSPDGLINALDMLQVGRAFGQRTGQPLYTTTKDPNEDGSVNALDMQILAGLFGKRCIQT